MPKKAKISKKLENKIVVKEKNRTFSQIEKDWNTHISHLGGFSTIHLKNDKIALNLQLEFAKSHDTAKFCKICKVIFNGRYKKRHPYNCWSLADICSSKKNLSDRWYAQRIWAAFVANDNANAASREQFAIHPYIVDNKIRCVEEDDKSILKGTKSTNQTQSKTDLTSLNCQLKNSLASSNLVYLLNYFCYYLSLYFYFSNFQLINQLGEMTCVFQQ